MPSSKDQIKWMWMYEIIHILNWGLMNEDVQVSNPHSYVMNTTWAVVKIKPKKNSGLCGCRNHETCDTGAVLYQLS